MNILRWGQIGATAKCAPTNTKKIAHITAQMRIDSVFFFQAEDGIRDYKVTGVQTCALPISSNRRRSARCTDPASLPHRSDLREPLLSPKRRSARRPDARPNGEGLGEIGRASCRERV